LFWVLDSHAIPSGAESGLELDDLFPVSRTAGVGCSRGRVVSRVKSFVVDGAVVVQCAMAAHRVAEGLDVLENRRCQLGSGGPDPAVEQFDLHGSEERLDHRVIKRRGHLAHKSEQACLAQPVTEQSGDILRAAVRMHHRTNGFAAQPGHVQGVGDQLGTPMIGDPPAHHPAGEHIEDDRGIHPALTRAVLGDVGDPQSVRALGAELTLNQVRPRGGRRPGPVPPATVHPFEPDEFHAAPGPLAADPPSLPVAQLGVDPTHTVGLTRGGVDRSDGVGQLRIIAVTGAGRPAAPFVEAHYPADRACDWQDCDSSRRGGGRLVRETKRASSALEWRPRIEPWFFGSEIIAQGLSLSTHQVPTPAPLVVSAPPHRLAYKCRTNSSHWDPNIQASVVDQSRR